MFDLIMLAKRRRRLEILPTLVAWEVALGRHRKTGDGWGEAFGNGRGRKHLGCYWRREPLYIDNNIERTSCSDC